MYPEPKPNPHPIWGYDLADPDELDDDIVFPRPKSESESESDQVDPTERHLVKEFTNKVNKEYKELKEKALTDAAARVTVDRFAKGMPIITKGLISAVVAFKKKDYMAGSAALMDICSGTAMLFPPPAGAMIGTLFNTIGQILTVFVLQQPSLEDKIEKLLRHIQSEEQKNKIRGFGHSVSSYTNAVRTKSAGVYKMEKPVMLAGTVSVTSDSKTVTGKGTTFTQTAEVGQWLMFDSDTSGNLYKIAAIGNDTSLTLTLPYVGASAASTRVMQVRRTTIRKGIADILAMPLTSESQADDFIIEMKGLLWGLAGEKEKLDAPLLSNWQVAGYLENQENQQKEQGWPEVLGIWCRTYTDLLIANVMLNSLADQKTLNRLLYETRETNNESLPNLPKHAKQECHRALIKLESLTSNLRESWESDNNEMLKIVQAIRPAAQERGMYAHLGYWEAAANASGYPGATILYTASGSGKKDALKWDYKDNTKWLNRISIHIPNAEKDSFTPKYEVFTCEDSPYTSIGRHTLDSVKNTLSNRTEVMSAKQQQMKEYYERILDVSAMAINDPHLGVSDAIKQPTALVSLVINRAGNIADLAMQNNKNDCVNLYVIDKDNKSTRINWQQPVLAGAKDVRNLYLPPTTVPDDPDADAMADKNAKPPGPPLLAQNGNSFLCYAGVRDSNKIYVVTWDEWGTVEGPEGWDSYNGIEVDPHYLWVFGKGTTGKYLTRRYESIACATHASIIKCRQGKIPRPNWIYHDFDKSTILDMWHHETFPVVTSLCPCADGTLVANIQGNIYTADYEIKLASHRIVTSSWVKRGGNAKQVIKMPIPCWSVLERLRATLLNLQVLT
jgi:hypothetical protein